MHYEWLVSQRACVKDLLNKCREDDFINKMSLQGRLEDIESEILLLRIQERKLDG